MNPMTPEPIYILDRVSIKPGQLSRYQQRLREQYLPGARARGLQLVGSWVTPPLEVEQGNELLLLWSLPDVRAFWAMRAGGGDPDAVAFWQQAAQLGEHRERRFLCRVELDGCA
jgi:hypothetical protein